MALSRRDFVKLCSGTVAGFGVSQMFHPAIHEAFAQTLTGERPPVFWVQGQGCTGCSVTLLNSTHPSIADVLLKIISLEFHPTVMAAEGEGAYEHMMRVAEKFKGKFIFAVEGAVPVAHDGKCCVVAEANHHEVTMTEVTKVLAANAAAVLAVGTCAAYGGIPAGKGNETGAMGVSAFLKKEGIPAPVINIPGCPPHPDWIVGTIGLGLQALATNTLGLLVKQGLDANGRPKAFYKNVHMNCPHLSAFEAGAHGQDHERQGRLPFQHGLQGPPERLRLLRAQMEQRGQLVRQQRHVHRLHLPDLPRRAVPLLRQLGRFPAGRRQSSGVALI